MKLSRHKFVRRLLNFYRRNYGVESPFVVLVDGTFAFEALQWKIQIDDQLKSYLETESVRCSTSLCAIKETELLGAIRCALQFVQLFFLFQEPSDTGR